jgi:cell wall assembly regulator SMI1
MRKRTKEKPRAGKVLRPTGDVAARWSVIAPWLRAQHPAVLAAFRPPAAALAIRAAEKAIGRALPADYKDFLVLHDGQRDHGSTMVARCSLFPTARLGPEHAALTKHFDAHAQLFVDSPVDPTLVDRGIRAVPWSAGWIPIGCTATGRSSLCLDLDPSVRGEVGQVILVALDDDARRVVAKSFTALLSLFFEQLQTGELQPTKPR